MRACFKCSQIGHLIRDCPRNTPGSGTAPNSKSLIKARVYVVTLGEVDLEAAEAIKVRVTTGIALTLP